MKYVIVYAHPNRRSFNHAVLERVEGILRAAGKSFEVRDLYAMRFNPTLDSTDLALIMEGKAPPDIEQEQSFIASADVVIFIYPVWWFGMPAMLKGYVDRVFSHGFAYAVEGERLTGLLGGKKAIIINTTGSPRELLARTGYEEAMKKTIDLGILGFCGMEIVEHRYLCAVESADDAARKRMLEDLATIYF
jgi:NAD(P)H dehydrogenase (quinone)